MEPFCILSSPRSTYYRQAGRCRRKVLIVVAIYVQHCSSSCLCVVTSLVSLSANLFPQLSDVSALVRLSLFSRHEFISLPSQTCCVRLIQLSIQLRVHGISAAAFFTSSHASRTEARDQVSLYVITLFNRLNTLLMWRIHHPCIVIQHLIFEYIKFQDNRFLVCLWSTLLEYIIYNLV
jgi:hypothetical protein